MYTNLSNTSKSKGLFKTFRLSFAAHPATKQLLTYSDADSVIQSVKRIVLTNHYERPFSPLFGGNILAQLFENFTPAFVSAIQFDIGNAIQKYEPRVARVNAVTVEDRSDANAISITIEFTIVNRKEPVSVDLFLERIR